ncbi:hypothetical protein CVT26_007992 [Gymnopilus dilepis]|uniref:Uncharacterized protein n=1 Tax=Gymnopilus dilepis TaxID=231916 RepID=A0A409WWB5_9AGAR|nr:hypothetical protein CVT26_007992 [Gymnopilus dilepis]
MLLYLILLYLSRITAHAAPLSLIGRSNLDVSGIPSDQSTCTCHDQRSVWDILWSCLATIFACSWVSVHPNMPGPDDSRTKIALGRLKLTFWAIVVPEMIIYWAIRQWLGARKLAREWREKKWTKTHGYFIQMGGFMLYKGELAEGILSPEKLKKLAGEGKIKFPTITEKEIQVRSKADSLSKTLVMGQTTWFILQCITRAIQKLEITQLEILTVALAFLNAFMYFFWWNKPLDVQTSVPVYLLDEPLEEALLVVPPKGMPDAPDALSLSAPFSDQASDSVAMTALADSEDSDEAANPLLPTSRSTSHLSAHTWIRYLWTSFQDAAKHVTNGISFMIGRIQKFVKEEGYAGAITAILLLGSLEIVVSFPMRLSDMAGSKHIDDGQMRVSTFYALDLGVDDSNVWMTVSAIAMAFGAIHCTGWALAFPSLTEAWIWRYSSIATSAIPLLLFLARLFRLWKAGAVDGSLMKEFLQYLGEFFLMSGLVISPVYMLARILLLVEAFIGLRVLTSSALAVVKWTSFLPHI